MNRSEQCTAHARGSSVHSRHETAYGWVTPVVVKLSGDSYSFFILPPTRITSLHLRCLSASLPRIIIAETVTSLSRSPAKSYLLSRSSRLSRTFPSSIAILSTCHCLACKSLPQIQLHTLAFIDDHQHTWRRSNPVVTIIITTMTERSISKRVPEQAQD